MLGGLKTIFGNAKDLTLDFTTGLTRRGSLGKLGLHKNQFKLVAGATALSLALGHGNLATAAASTIPIADASKELIDSGRQWREGQETLPSYTLAINFS